MGNLMYILVVCNDCNTRGEVFCRLEELPEKLKEEVCDKCGSKDRKKVPFFSAGLLRTTGFTKRIIV